MPGKNYRHELWQLYLARFHSSTAGFVLNGIFSGLLLAGFIYNVPPVALGIGCAVNASLCIYGIISNQAKMRDLE